MGRPKINYTGQLVGTLKIGERILTAKHARFSHTCMVCGNVGESDARYLHHGCQQCKLQTQPERNHDNVQVVTGTESFWVTTLQLVKALRENPLAQFYYRGKRTIVTETDEDIVMSLPAIEGLARGEVFSKFTQELGDHSIVKPEAAYEEPVQITPPEYQTSIAPVAAPVKTRLEELVYTPPEGAFLLDDPADKVWLTDDWPTDRVMPKYLKAWFDSFPRGTTFRLLVNNKVCYGLTTPPLPVDTSYDLSDDSYETYVAPPRNPVDAPPLKLVKRLTAEEQVDKFNEKYPQKE